MLGFQFFEADGPASADGVFLPLPLPGLTASELAASQSSQHKEAKALMAVLETLQQVVTPAFKALGFVVSKSSPVGVGVADGTSILNQNYTLTWQKLCNLDTNTITPVPLPTVGSNAGVGEISLATVFPGATKVASGNNVGGAGLLVRSDALTGYTNLTHSTLNLTQGREWLSAVADHFGFDAVVRDPGVQTSAIITATTEAVSAIDIPESYLAATNPVSGIPNGKQYGLITRAHSYTVQLQLNPVTQTFDVFVA